MACFSILQVRNDSFEALPDAGVFWFSEKLSFPDEREEDSMGIMFRREQGETIGENPYWEQTKIMQVALTWNGSAFEPSLDAIKWVNEEEH